ncbi:MAG: acyltransferase family protein [Beijerinckiaceae bacterium]
MPDMTARYAALTPDNHRSDWVDVAKALCIILVVMMHSTLGYQEDIGHKGFLGPVVAYFAPFRVPTLFILSGLFLAKAMQRNWSEFLNARIGHFVYFYLLWAFIQCLFKCGAVVLTSPVLLVEHMAWTIAEPYGTLWFIHLLAVFSLVTYALRRVNPLIVVAAAAVLHILPIKTGSTLVDEFALRYVFFVMGWAFATRFFMVATLACAMPGRALISVSVFALLNGLAVHGFGISKWPGISLLLGTAGAAALIAIAVWLSRLPHIGRIFASLGQQTLVVFVAFFLPMAITRVILVKLGIGAGGGWIIGFASLLITAVAVITPLLMARLVQGTWFAFLFQRPGFGLSGFERPLAAPILSEVSLQAHSSREGPRETAQPKA